MATTQTIRKKTAASKSAKKPAIKKASPASAKNAASLRKVAGPAKTTGKKPVKSSGKRLAKSIPAPNRYRCRLCGYIYSPLRGEPHNGIPAGTEFEDLPEDYVCPVCGQQGKGRIGKWGFEEWRPTKYICSVCAYVYDEKRGEPHRNIKPGTKFEDLPDDYACPVCALDPRIHIRFGKVFKQGFEPLYLG